MNIGIRIRELRKKNNLTLHELSKKSSVALATLSRIETGRMTGTLQSHMNIAKALSVTLPDLYTGLDKPITIRKDDIAELFVHDDRVSSAILTKDIFTKKMLPILTKLKPGAKTYKEQLRTGTEKFVYAVEGAVEVVVAGERTALGKGSSLYFDASRVHFIRNTGTGEAVCLSVSTPTTA